jgi:hypothetical protein
MRADDVAGERVRFEVDGGGDRALKQNNDLRVEASPLHDCALSDLVAQLLPQTHAGRRSSHRSYTKSRATRAAVPARQRPSNL